MKFTIESDSELARAIRARQGMDMTLYITAHNPTFTDVQKLVNAKLMQWTCRTGCDHTPAVMEVEWLDSTKFLESRG